MTNLTLSFRSLSWWVVLALAVALPTAPANAGTNPAELQGSTASTTSSSAGTAFSGFEKSGQQLDLTAVGVELKAGFAATVDIDGKQVSLSSEEGQPVGHPEDSKEATPYGEADVTTSWVEFPSAGVTLGLKMGGITKEGFIIFQPLLKNTGSRPLKLLGLQSLETNAAGQEMTLTGELPQWILTPLDHSKEKPALTLDTVPADGMRIHDAGTLYRQRRHGISLSARSAIRQPIWRQISEPRPTGCRTSLWNRK